MTPPVGLFSLRGLPLARRALVFVCFRAISDALASLADSKQTWRAGGQRAECKRLSHPDELEPPQPGRLVVCEPARDRWEPNWRSIQLELGASHDQRGGGRRAQTQAKCLASRRPACSLLANLLCIGAADVAQPIGLIQSILLARKSGTCTVLAPALSVRVPNATQAEP